MAQEKSSGGIILSEVTYTYDLFNRRIAKIVDPDAQGPQAADQTQFVYDGQHVWADFDEGGAVKARYLFGDQIDQLIARYRPGEGTAWYLADHLGTIRDLVDANGALINHVDYDSFGRVIGETNPAAGDRFKFTGREWDAELTLYYYRARYYDPALGRFVSQDPIGFGAGDPNLYRYVGNSPLTATDPLGQKSLVEYAAMIGRGPIGRIIASTLFRCFMREITAWAISRAVIGAAVEGLGGQPAPLGHNDVATISLGVMACTMWPGSAMAQSAFLLVTETLYLYTTGASTTDIAITALTHTLGIAGGGGLSRYRSKVWGFLADESGSARIPRASKTAVEAASRARAQAYLGRNLRTSVDPAFDYIDDLGRTYDQMGNPAMIPHWTEQKGQFFGQIDRHLAKADFTVVDLTDFPKHICDEVADYVLSLPEQLFDKLIPIGF